MESSSVSRDRLIQAGIHEIEANGLAGFSLRRVAQLCGVSCAAPYKHFKNKGDLIAAIAQHYNAQWVKRQRAVLDATEPDITKQLQELCKEYLRFLLDNPNYCTLVTLTDAATGKWYMNSLLDGSTPSKRMIQAYCEYHHMSPDTAHVKIELLRGLFFGVAMLVGSGELKLTEPRIEMLYREINSAFLS
ncbi:MAG: TetR/AcrR family transcriptional regulator [Clostridia bacterium]|nr:TetR/AcrR family transcriptional regulator [Clostridia bacterium]